ncbi:(2Fe-2S)-binding protein [Staphylococcus gallinarum]|uniref:(2Fe-2S)-binding protein n=1 Tax=Staphylococcus gallinarum TaxID=1293 RepID=UPI001E3A9D6B|nr:(2Fe-2S)-binding protein [Staphylococcus gallinarum]MCD8909445.1 (2Fe-2S)-binding protein [Staphylococcus gallinarum]MCD8919964.1 (2Fe-2S)-binding protein [Staphylococcus gallinarum]UEH00258.1 (2Fe-2S)-binding protein [Staphylococcus gallinarum]
MVSRIVEHPVLGDLELNEEFTFSFNGEEVVAYKGDTIASALLASNYRKLRENEISGDGRGIYCNIGHCFECRVKLHDRRIVRACITQVEEGMQVYSLRK